MTTPNELVVGSYNNFFGFAETAFNKSLEFLGDLQLFEVPLLSVNVTYESPTANAPPFTLPPEPVAPLVNFEIGLPPTPPLASAISGIDPGSAPSFSGSEPSLSFPPRPSPLDVQAPSDAPVLVDPTLPEAPVLDFPDAPALREITLPNVPDVSFPTFDAPVPPLDIEIPSIGVNFTETPYTSLLLTETTARVRTMLAGGTGLPAAVETALFDRARGRLDKTLVKATAEAFEQWSARGFAEPGGELSARLAEVREQNRDAVRTLVRDIYIRAQEVEIENLRFAVQQGIALESMLITYAAGFAQRALQAQELIARVAVDVFNGRINLYNAQLAGYRTQAEVFRALIEAERGKIELYRTQIEAAVAVGQLNEQEVRIYAEKVRALQLRVDIFEAQIQAVNAQVEVDKTRIEAYRATIQAFAERVGAKEAEFEAYGEEVRAQGSIVQAYEASVRAFAERTRAYSVGVEAKATSKRVELDAARLRIETFQAELQAYKAGVDAQVSKTTGALNLYDGQARIFTARLGAEGARVESSARQFQAEIENARNNAAIALQNATANAENAIRAASVALEALKTQATVASQVAAGALSAVNLSASISGTSTQTTSVDHNVSYEGVGSPPILG